MAKMTMDQMRAALGLPTAAMRRLNAMRAVLRLPSVTPRLPSVTPPTQESELTSLFTGHTFGIRKTPLNVPAAVRVAQMIRRGDGRGNMHPDRLVVMNMGLGRDSMTMLALLVEGKLQAEGKNVRPQDLDAIVFADTGMEWQHTYQVITHVHRLLAQIKEKTGVTIPFYNLKKPPKAAYDRYHNDLLELRRNEVIVRMRDHQKIRNRAWRDNLRNKSMMQKADGGYYHNYAPIEADYMWRRPKPYMVSFTDAACTIAHKISPIRMFMQDLAHQKYRATGFDYTHANWGRRVKKGEVPPHLNLIGYASGEGSNWGGPRELYLHPYNPERIDQIYALMDLMEARTKAGKPESKTLEGKLKTIEQKGNWYTTEAFPLVEMGISKDDEAPILARHRLQGIRKSGCVMCHSQPMGWWWVLREQAISGKQWAVDYWGDIQAHEEASITSGGSAFIKSDAYQRDDDGAILRGTNRRRINDVVNLIYQKKVLPKINALMIAQGLSEGQARSRVMNSIMEKNYVQGCLIPAEGSPNQMKLCDYHRDLNQRYQ